jgi:hypothetical protein
MRAVGEKAGEATPAQSPDLVLNFTLRYEL